jgi:hypothetical protein
MSKGDEGSWSIMLDRFRSEENAQEKNKLLYGLGNLTTSLRLESCITKSWLKVFYYQFHKGQMRVG